MGRIKPFAPMSTPEHVAGAPVAPEPIPALRSLLGKLRTGLPRGKTLPDDVWARRHRWLSRLLYAHAIGLPLFGVSQGFTVRHSLVEGAIILAFALPATLLPVGRRLASTLVSVGLLTSSAVLVHLWGGVIEGHFHFFVMISLLTLYEDWLPFLMSAAYVLVHHGLMGVVDPDSVYIHTDGREDPWKWAAIHALFVAGAGLAGVLSWRLNEEARDEAKAAYLQVRESEGELRRSSEQLQAILDNSPAVIYVKDRERRHLTVNHQFEEVFGVSREEVIGKRDEDFLPESLVPQCRAGDLEVLSKGTTIQHEERLEPDNGDARTFITAKFPLRDQHGTPNAVCGISTDITERARFEEEKARLEEGLHQAQRLESVGQLAGGIAHDFNNILAVILNYAAFVSEDLPDRKELREDVEEISRAAERGTALTRQLLVFSRREAVEPSVLCLNEVVTSTSKLLRRALGEHINLETALGPDLWSVKADAGQMEQVLMNLALNARDAMPDGGKLTITTANAELDPDYARILGDVPPGRYVRLTVSDTGGGMPEAVADRAFDPFFTTKPKGQGTGLGLATVYGIARQAGGSVHLYSEVGRGTSIKVHLPAVAQAVEGREPLEEPVPPEEGGNRTILVVEDEDAVRSLTTRILSRNGYRVIEAAGGHAALTAVESHGHPPDLLLTDVVMPDMLGPELGEQMGKLYPDMPVVYMSGYNDRVLENEVGFLEKPFDATSLLRIVEEALRRRGSTAGPRARVENFAG